jgi:hypothetical protein
VNFFLFLYLLYYICMLVNGVVYHGGDNWKKKRWFFWGGIDVNAALVIRMIMWCVFLSCFEDLGYLEVCMRICWSLLYLGRSNWECTNVKGLYMGKSKVQEWFKFKPYLYLVNGGHEHWHLVCLFTLKFPSVDCYLTYHSLEI